MKTITSHSLEETKKVAAEWVECVSAQALSLGKVDKGVIGEAAVVGLSGHLGSGKTTFVQAVAATLGIKEFVTSPTFVIMKIYSVFDHARFKKLIHIDAYRLGHGKELEALDFEKLVSDTGNLIIIEWPENVKEGLPDNIQSIAFEAVGESARKITMI